MLILILLVLFPLMVQSGGVPSSDRSREAIARVKPKLESRMKQMGLEWGSPVFMRVFKEEKEFEVWIRKDSSFVLFRTYPVCEYGWGELGPKERRGDRQAPEGFYGVIPARMNPYSRYHLSFDIGYPNTYDQYHKRTGGALMVHGGCLSNGCFAMTDPLMEEIYALVDAAFRNSTDTLSIHIFPFRMIPEKMKKHQNEKWTSFWQNLKEGYDFFGQHSNNPPVVEIRDGKYCFLKE